MRVVVAPDKFAGTLTAVEAAAAIAEGWARRAPDDEVMTVPMSDGGPGFLDVLHASLGGELVVCTATDPYGHEVPGAVLVHRGGGGDRDDAGGGRVTAYVESAQALGLHLTDPDEREPLVASSAGLGALLGAARDAGADRVVVGLGGSAVNDGGAGLLGALGATAEDADGAAVDLAGGVAALEGIAAIDVTAVVEAWHDVEVVVASDVENPLLGLFGATKTYGPQKGLTEEQMPYAEGRLAELVAAVDAVAAGLGTRAARAEGAGAAGGTGFALLLLGGTRTPGVGLVAEAVGLSTAVAGADLVITGEGAFDFSSRSGKVPYGVAEAAGAVLAPCVALAGQVLVGARETRALGIDAAYGLVDLVGEERAFADPRGALRDLAERVARTWSRQR